MAGLISNPYAIAAVLLVAMGLGFALFGRDAMRRLLAINIAGSGIFLFLIVVADLGEGRAPDPVPHAMVITGIVVSVSATALALALMSRKRMLDDTGQP